MGYLFHTEGRVAHQSRNPLKRSIKHGLGCVSADRASWRSTSTGAVTLPGTLRNGRFYEIGAAKLSNVIKSARRNSTRLYRRDESRTLRPDLPPATTLMELFQHAWSEAEHDLGTRPVGLSPPKTSDSWHSRHPKAGVQTEPSLNYMNATVRLQPPRDPLSKLLKELIQQAGVVKQAAGRAHEKVLGREEGSREAPSEEEGLIVVPERAEFCMRNTFRKHVP